MVDLSIVLWLFTRGYILPWHWVLPFQSQSELPKAPQMLDGGDAATVLELGSFRVIPPKKKHDPLPYLIYYDYWRLPEIHLSLALSWLYQDRVPICTHGYPYLLHFSDTLISCSKAGVAPREPPSPLSSAHVGWGHGIFPRIFWDL